MKVQMKSLIFLACLLQIVATSRPTTLPQEEPLDVADRIDHLRHRQLPILNGLRTAKDGIVGTVVSLLYFQLRGLDLMLQILKIREAPCAASNLSADAILEAAPATLISDDSSELAEPDALLVTMGLLNVAITAFQCGAKEIPEASAVKEMALMEDTLEYLQNEPSFKREQRIQNIISTVKQNAVIFELLDASTSLTDLLAKLQDFTVDGPP